MTVYILALATALSQLDYALVKVQDTHSGSLATRFQFRLPVSRECALAARNSASPEFLPESKPAAFSRLFLPRTSWPEKPLSMRMAKSFMITTRASTTCSSPTATRIKCPNSGSCASRRSCTSSSRRRSASFGQIP